MVIFLIFKDFKLSAGLLLHVLREVSVIVYALWGEHVFAKEENAGHDTTVQQFNSV